MNAMSSPNHDRIAQWRKARLITIILTVFILATPFILELLIASKFPNNVSSNGSLPDHTLAHLIYSFFNGIVSVFAFRASCKYRNLLKSSDSQTHRIEAFILTVITGTLAGIYTLLIAILILLTLLLMI